MGKSTISMAIFQFAMFVYQRVNLITTSLEIMVYLRGIIPTWPGQALFQISELVEFA